VAGATIVVSSRIICLFYCEGPAESPQEGGAPLPDELHSLGYPRCRTNGGHSEAGLQGSVPEETVHREGRCAASGEAPDRGVPTAVR
jgi:hypothetical protein